MRKGVLTILLAACLLSGCSGRTYVLPEDYTTRTAVDGMPFTMDYNGTEVKVKSIELYQSQNEETYVWHPQAIIRVDISNLTEEQIFLLTNSQGIPDEVDMQFDVLYTSEQNDVSHERMTLVTDYVDNSNKELVYIYYEYNKVLKKDLSDISIDLTATLIQDETYEKNGHKYNKENQYTYEMQDVIPSSDELTGTELDMFERGLARIARTGF